MIAPGDLTAFTPTVNNNLIGTIPAELVGLVESLEFIDTSENGFTETIPSAFGELDMVTHIDLSRNNLTGSIPPSMFDLETLRELFLHSNVEWTGTLSPNVGNAINLAYFSMFLCNLNAPLPPSMAKLENLEFVELFSNSFTGSIPDGVTQLPKLELIGLVGYK
jgi:Leucine-rich repeat (LRR) protein